MSIHIVYKQYFLTCISHIVFENLSTCEQEVKQRIFMLEWSLDEIKETIVNYMRPVVARNPYYG